MCFVIFTIICYKLYTCSLNITQSSFLTCTPFIIASIYSSYALIKSAKRFSWFKMNMQIVMVCLSINISQNEYSGLDQPCHERGCVLPI